MQTLQHASLKKNYIYQIQIILADIQDRAYNFIIESPEASTFLLGRIKYVMLLFQYYILGLPVLEAIKQ